MTNRKYGQKINFKGDTWTIVGVGATIEGKTYLHLASETRFIEQKNGKRPVQAGEWVPEND